MSERSSRGQSEPGVIGSAAEVAPKPYTAPKLRHLGSVRELTLGGSQPMMENFFSMRMALM